MKKILDGMRKTMNAEKPPRITALKDLHDAEDHGPFSILIGTILSARTKDESTTRIVKDLFKVYKMHDNYQKPRLKMLKKLSNQLVSIMLKHNELLKLQKLLIQSIKEKFQMIWKN